MHTLSLRFIKWGTGLMLLGLLTGYGPLMHYLGAGVDISCPWAPVHGHVVLLGWVGMTLFGLVYKALPDWGTPGPVLQKLAGAHLWIAILSVLGVYVNGIWGYRYLDRLSPSFFYKPEMDTLRLWLTIDGWFLSLYGIGCILFLIVLFGSTRKSAAGAAPA